MGRIRSRFARRGAVLTAVPLLLLLAGCGGQTTAATDITSTSAVLHASVQCDPGDVAGGAGCYYEFRTRPDGSGPWTSYGVIGAQTTATGGRVDANVTAENLTPGNTYDVEICGVGNQTSQPASGSMPCAGTDGKPYNEVTNSNATKFTTLTAPLLIDCSKPLMHSVRLVPNTAFINCEPGTPITFGRDHITLNLGGQAVDHTFGSVVKVDGHRYDTVENGSVYTQATGIVETNAHHFTVRNVDAGGDSGGMLFSGGSDNRIVDSTADGRFAVTSLKLTQETGDVLRDVKTNQAFGCQIELSQTTHTRLAGSSTASVLLDGSDHNRISRNTVVNSTDPTKPTCHAPGGITGTGNYNLVSRNTVSGGQLSITGTGNRIFGNTVSP